MTERVEADWVKERLDDEGIEIINVLSAEAYAKEHIPGTSNVPVDAPDFEERIRAEVPDMDTPIVVYCASLSCQASPRAAQKLEQMGYRKVYDYKAGMQGWKEAGFKVEGETRRVRAEAEPAGEAEPA